LDEVQVTGAWPSDATSASGQVFEFRLWALLTEQSRASLHVFLPLADRGIDALVHRLTDDVYIPIQAKARSSLRNGQVEIAVWAESLRDDNAMLISGLITEGGLGPTMLAITEGDFKRLAYQTVTEGRAAYVAMFGMHPRSDSKWLRWLVPTVNLAERLGVSVGLEGVAGWQPPEWRSNVGFLGEAEAIRLLATSRDLNLFRPFPDTETAELVVLHLGSRRVVGLQIKTVEVDKTRMRSVVDVHERSFRESPTTYFVVLAWLGDESRFHEDCLLIPSMDLRSFARQDHYGHMAFEFHPGIPSKYSVGRDELCRRMEVLVS
jgi:hypothetical protein